jgi:predicted DNA-binding transcriptional regulator AlpA
MTTLMAEESLIDTSGIASLLGCTREHATDRIIKKPGFPKPRIELSQKMRRWDKDEVMAFLTTKKRRS